MADDLDDLLRRAMKSLDDQVPSGYFEGLPARTLARLDSSGDDRMQTSSTDREQSTETSSGAPVREEDSGLHDIRNLAQSTKQRLSSQKIPTRSDEDVLASSSAGWKAVALPAPAGAVSLPDVSDLPSKKELKRRAAEGSVATAVPAPEPAVTPITARIAAKKPVAPARGPGKVFAIVGVGLAAAAGAVIFVSTRDTADKAAAPADRAPASEPKQAAPAPAANAETVPQRVQAQTAVIATDGAQGQNAAGAGSAAPGPKSDEGAAGAPVEPTPPPVTKFAKPPAKKPEPVKTKGSAGKTKRDEIDKLPPKDDASKKAPASDSKKAPVSESKKPSGDPNFDDLLKEAGVNQKKDDKPKLDKKELTKDDFTRGIGGVAGAASKCYQGQQGTASVKLVIGPNGRVQKVTVSGVFAGTPVANCVSAAVKSATFSPWDGGPQSFNYSFLLSE